MPRTRKTARRRCPAHLPHRRRTGAAAGLRAHPLPAGGCRPRYHANDNIAAFVREGELAELKAEVQAKMQEVLRALVIDTDSDHNTHETASGWPRCTSTRSSAAATCPCPR
jgi:hypothetical protein